MRMLFPFYIAFLVFFAVDASTATQELSDLSDAFAEIAARVNPSVVNISCTQAEGEILSGDEADRRVGFGSGVIIDSEGYVLTSNHVIESATKIEVKLSDDRKFVAKLIGQDQETDLALIKVESKLPLPAAPLGDSDMLRPGQLVMAIGNPFVYDHTVTVGVISAINRKLGATIFDNFIQTDAAINFGNSGGPLLNVKGEVIGINTLISSQGTGIGFSIPINMAKEILEQLKQKGRVSRGFLGLVPQEITEDLQKSLDLDVKEGVIISSVQRGSPAEKSGLKRYDVIQEFGGKKIESEDQFRRFVAEAAPGKSVRLKIQREDQTLVVDVMLSERNPASPLPAAPTEGHRLGLYLEDLDAYHRSFITDYSSGAVVSKIVPGSSADASELLPGDVILEADKKSVKDADSLEKYLSGLESGGAVLLYIFRGGTYIFLTLSIP